jgi:DNA-binding PadR family transcriptional regulator
MLGFFRHWHHHHHGRDADPRSMEFMGRGHRHGGFGFDPHGGSGPGDFGFGGAGRKLSSVDLQLLLLALLEEQPRHGYELIKALDERSGGFYTPSPGVIYPALSYLEEVDYTAVELEGTKKRYSLTDQGRAYLDKQRAAVDAMLLQLQRAGERMAHVRRAVGEAEELGVEFGARRGHGARHALHAALHEVKDALRERFGRGRSGDDADLQQVLVLLRDLAATIRKR